MYTTRSSKYNRLLEKTPEQIFINSLRKEFELSPAESKGILDLAKQCLFGQVPSVVGKIKYICASNKAKHGKPLSEQEMVQVELTLDGGIDDLNVLKDQGPKALRQLKVLRLSEEAWEQGGSLTQEDLARILQVTSRSIRQDIKELVGDGNFIHTRGTDHDIGRSLTHKSRIIQMYLEGQTYDEIMRRSRHSAFSIKRYVLGFGRLLLLISGGIEEVKPLSRLLSQSERLTLEYLEIYERHKAGDKWPAVYTELLDQLKAMYPSKKKSGKGVRHEG
jgi:DNA-binding CsgD family transcriptional regulator